MATTIITQLFGTAKEKSQILFTKLESKVIKLYGKLSQEFIWRKNEEEKLSQIQKKTSDYYEQNKDLLSALDDEKEEKRMKTSRWAYRTIPLADTALALFPLLTIVEKEWTSVPLFKFPLTITLGLFFSLIGRWTANELIHKTGKKQFAYICVFIVPSIYWINYLGFNNGSLIFTVLFSLISGGVQFFIIYFFPGLHHAVSYSSTKKKYIRLVKKENAQIEKLAKHTQDFSRKFYSNLWQAYHNLHTAFQTHVDRFTTNPNISLSQMMLCVCNLAFYNYEAIPYRRRGDMIEGAMLIVNVPEISELFLTGEVRFFAYMLRQSGRSSQFTELVSQANSVAAIADNNVNRQLPQSPTSLPISEPASPSNESTITNNVSNNVSSAESGKETEADTDDYVDNLF